MTIKILMCAICTFYFYFDISAQDYNVLKIADSLKRDAHAVIRFDSVFLDIRDIHGYTFFEEKVITILDGTLEKMSFAAVPYGDREVVSNFNASLYDANGDLIKKSDQNTAVDLSANGEMVLAGSGRLKVHYLGNVKAPFTIKYSYQKQVRGSLFMPVFMPSTAFDVSIEHATLTISTGPSLNIKFNCSHITQPQATNLGYKMEMNGVRAIKDEEYGPLAIEVLPCIHMMLNSYEFYNMQGSSDSWSDVGRFINTISPGNVDLKHLTDRDLNNIIELKESRLEKVKALYSYLQHNFHYAGYEVGIGGWKPEDALATLKKKYGDCKGLVTVIKALLSKAGIESYYTLINAGKNSQIVRNDFPCFDFNHVILCVPLNNDTLWLECTDPQAPFNYLDPSLSNKNALLIYPGGGRLIITPVHGEAYNTCRSLMRVKLNEENKSEISDETTIRGDLQDTLRHFIGQNNHQLLESATYYTLHLKNTTISSFSVKELEPDSALVEINLALKNESAIKKTAARIFLKTDIITPVPYIPGKNESRSQPVCLRNAYCQTDTLYYNLPPGFKSENFKPNDDKNITSQFGFANCSLNYSTETGILILIRSFCLKAGIFSKEQYPAFRDFLLQASKTTCPEIVLKKIE